MKRTRYLLLPLLILAGLFVVGCGEKSAADVTTLNIVATGNIWGEIEPCG